jgi:hypothetical protein
MLGIPIGYIVVALVTIIAAPILWQLARLLFSKPAQDLADLEEDAPWMVMANLIDFWYLSWPIFKLFVLILLSIPVVAGCIKLVMYVLRLS